MNLSERHLIEPHEYVATEPYKGCGNCGYGPGAFCHNMATARSKAEREAKEALAVSQSAARGRIAKALGLIERAQNDLERASQELSAITNGGSRLMDLVFKERTRVNAIWHKVDAALSKDRRTPKFDLDELHKRAL